jgi:hypothetical protein
MRAEDPNAATDFARTCLYQAAGVLLTKVDRWPPLKAWGSRLMKQSSARRRRSPSLASWPSFYIGWIDGTDFRWTKEAVAA